MSEISMRIQLHFMKLIHRICQKRFQRVYDKSGNIQDLLNAEYHKTIIRLLKKKDAFLTNDEKVYVIKRIAKEHDYALV